MILLWFVGLSVCLGEFHEILEQKTVEFCGNEMKSAVGENIARYALIRGKPLRKIPDVR